MKEIIEQAQFWVDNGKPELAASVYVGHRLQRDVPNLKVHEFDLNPQLVMLDLCEQIANDSTTAGFPCTREYVMTHWATAMYMYGSMIHPTVKLAELPPGPGAESWAKDYEMHHFWFKEILAIWDAIPVKFRGDVHNPPTILDKVKTMAKVAMQQIIVGEQND